MLGRIVLIPFLEGRWIPNGIEAQQKAETAAENIFGKASSAIGMMVGLNRAVKYLRNTRSREIATQISQEVPDLDGIKNYVLLISFAEKVTNLYCLLLLMSQLWKSIHVLLDILGAITRTLTS